MAAAGRHLSTRTVSVSRPQLERCFARGMAVAGICRQRSTSPSTSLVSKRLARTIRTAESSRSTRAARQSWTHGSLKVVSSARPPKTESNNAGRVLSWRMQRSVLIERTAEHGRDYQAIRQYVLAADPRVAVFFLATFNL